MRLLAFVVPPAERRFEPPPVGSLADGDVHLHQATLTAAVDPAASAAVLSADEWARADRLSEPARRRFVTTRRVLRTVLAAYVDADPATLVFGRGPTGKPRLQRSDVRFNLAHAGHRMLVGIARNREIGVDLERVDPRIDAVRIARRIFRASEVAALERLASSDRVRGFTRAWAAHEALVKMMGTGMFASSRLFAVEVDPTLPLTGETELDAAAALAEVPVDAEFAGALAVADAREPRVVHWRE
jgi:4'-phosphopantetheinyl transferase